MKFTKLLAAGLALATLGMGVVAPAEAQRGPGPDRHYSQNDHRGRHDDRRYRGRGNDRRNWNNNRRCRTEWRHNRRVQICR